MLKFSYGSGNEVNKTLGNAPGNLPPGTTLDQAISSLRPSLGYGQNVEGHIGGVPQNGSLALQDGMTVSIHDKACGKALAN